MHTYSSWVVGIPNLETVFQIPWSQIPWPQEIQGQGHSIKVIPVEATNHASTPVPFMGNVRTKFGDCSSNTLGTTGATQFCGWTDRHTDEHTDFYRTPAVLTAVQ